MYGLYGVGHMAKDQSASERRNLLLPLHGLLFPIGSKGHFYMNQPRQNSIYYGHSHTSRGTLAGTGIGSKAPP